MTTPAEIVAQCARCFGVSAEAILHARDRHEPLATARKVAMVLVNERLANTCLTGGVFKRSHSMVCDAERTTDPRLIECVRRGEAVDLKLAKPYQKKNSRKVIHHCDCGRLAVRYERGWACQRCLDIDSRIHNVADTQQIFRKEAA